MKGFLFFGLLMFLFAFHGIGQVVLPSVEKIEFREPNIVGTHYNPPISINIDLNQIGNNDTLVISGSYRDCGEWGGHYEHIYISRKKSNLFCWLKIDSCLCCHKLQKIHYYIPDDKNKIKKNPLTDTIILSKKKRQLISDYFIYFGHIGERWSGFLIMSTNFSIIKNRKEIYYREDPLGEWAGFINLKKKLFLK
jgi:hypothetical protein